MFELLQLESLLGYFPASDVALAYVDAVTGVLPRRFPQKLGREVQLDGAARPERRVRVLFSV